MLSFLTSSDVDAHEALPLEEGKPAVSIVNSDFNWDKKDSKATLSNINLVVRTTCWFCLCLD